MSDVAAALAGLKQKFLARAADDLAELRAWSANGAPADEATRHRVHRLAGAAGTFGFHALSDLAKKVDDRLVDGDAVGASEAEALIHALQALAA